MEIDKMTGIKGVTLSLGDDVNTLVLSDVGGAFIINDVNAGTYNFGIYIQNTGNLTAPF